MSLNKETKQNDTCFISLSKVTLIQNLRWLEWVKDMKLSLREEIGSDFLGWKIHLSLLYPIWFTIFFRLGSKRKWVDLSSNAYTRRKHVFVFQENTFWSGTSRQGCRIHQLHLCREVILAPTISVLGMKLNNIKVRFQWY